MLSPPQPASAAAKTSTTANIDKRIRCSIGTAASQGERGRRARGPRRRLRRPCPSPRSTSSATSRPACRRSRSPASARCPTCPRRTTGFSATSSSTSGSRGRSAGCASRTSRAARATARTSSRKGGAAAVVGVDANPEAHEHARLRYVRDGLTLQRTLVELYDEPCDAVVFLQTIEHVRNPGEILDRFRKLVGPGGIAFVSTPNVLTLAPPGAERSGNPWHVHEYRPEEFAALCRAHFASVELYGLFHARKLASHAAALRLGWDRVHQGLGITQRFYDRFTPAIDVRDFALRRAPARELNGALDLVAVLRA